MVAAVTALVITVIAGCGTMPPGDVAGSNGLGDTTGTCNVAFFNDDFAYGFDLPTLADLVHLDDTAEAVGGWPIASILCIGIVSLTFLQIARIRAKPQKRLIEAMDRLVRSSSETSGVCSSHRDLAAGQDKPNAVK